MTELLLPLCEDCKEEIKESYPRQPWPGVCCKQCAEIRIADQMYYDEYRAVLTTIEAGYQVSCALRHETGVVSKCAVCDVLGAQGKGVKHEQ